MTEGIGGATSGPGDGRFQLPATGSLDFVKDFVRETGTEERLKGRTGFAEVLRREMGKDNRLTAENTTGRTDPRLLDACYEMESIFVGYMLRSMRRTIDESDFFGKSIAKDIFRDMLYDEYAKMMARTDQLGIARQIYNQLRVQ